MEQFVEHFFSQLEKEIVEAVQVSLPERVQQVQGRIAEKLDDVRKCSERKCEKEWVLSKMKQSKLGRLIKLRY